MRTSRLLLLLVAAACAVAFALTVLVALHTQRGLSLDRSVLERVSGNAPLPFRTAGQRTLRTIDAATVAGAVLVLVFLAVARRRVARAVAAAAVVALSVGSADTALIANLPPGAYTFQVTSASNTTGEALGEVYELP
ncbi:MAG: hypothetical protein ABSB24_19680 [Gaiellaceae bacterium]